MNEFWTSSQIHTHAGPLNSGYMASLLHRRVEGDEGTTKQYAYQVVDVKGAFVGKPIGPFDSASEALDHAHRWIKETT